MSVEIINTLTKVYDTFNQEMFDGKLPPCVITLGKKAKALGVYKPASFASKEEGQALVVIPEIMLIPSTFKERSTIEIFSTVLHEQAHHWRDKVSTEKQTKRHHDAVWAKKMVELGLKPYNIKNPAKMTGRNCTHTIIEGGVFETIAKRLIEEGNEIKYFSLQKPKKTKKRVKTVKYVCPHCGIEARGIEGLNILCQEHEELMVAV